MKLKADPTVERRQREKEEKYEEEIMQLKEQIEKQSEAEKNSREELTVLKQNHAKLEKELEEAKKVQKHLTPHQIIKKLKSYYKVCK